MIHRRILLYASLCCLLGVAVWAAPADDGQSAGTRSWVLTQGRQFVAVTPSDSADLAIAPTRYIVTAGIAGAVCVLAMRGADDGTTTTNVTLAAGILHPIQAKRIMAASTTCTSIVAVY